MSKTTSGYKRLDRKYNIWITAKLYYLGKGFVLFWLIYFRKIVKFTWSTRVALPEPPSASPSASRPARLTCLPSPLSSTARPCAAFATFATPRRHASRTASTAPREPPHALPTAGRESRSAPSAPTDSRLLQHFFDQRQILKDTHVKYNIWVLKE